MERPVGSFPLWNQSYQWPLQAVVSEVRTSAISFYYCHADEVDLHFKKKSDVVRYLLIVQSWKIYLTKVPWYYIVFIEKIFKNKKAKCKLNNHIYEGNNCSLFCDEYYYRICQTRPRLKAFFAIQRNLTWLILKLWYKNVKCLKNVIPRLIFSINLPKKYTWYVSLHST